MVVEVRLASRPRKSPLSLTFNGKPFGTCWELGSELAYPTISRICAQRILKGAVGTYELTKSRLPARLSSSRLEAPNTPGRAGRRRQHAPAHVRRAGTAVP